MQIFGLAIDVLIAKTKIGDLLVKETSNEYLITELRSLFLLQNKKPPG